MVMARDPLGFAFQLEVLAAEDQHESPSPKNQETLPSLQRI
jgi:hypothetical protein